MHHRLRIPLFLFVFLALICVMMPGQGWSQTTNEKQQNKPSIKDSTQLKVAAPPLYGADTIQKTKPLIDSLPINEQPGIQSNTLVSDSIPIDSTIVLYFVASIDSLKVNSLHHIDTSMTYFHQYDPIDHKNKMYASLSNIGLAHKNRLFTPTLSTGYHFDNTTFTYYQYQNKDVRYYKEYVPYTSLQYVLGSKKEQNFNLIFSRELIKGLSFGIEFVTNNSPGPYTNSKSNNTRYYLTSQYYTPNKRYGVLVNYLNSKVSVEENGGLKYDSIFENNLESDRRVLPVNLSTASNDIKERSFFMEQYFNILKPQTESSGKRMDPGSISYSFQYQNKYQLYQDNPAKDSLYYMPFAALNDTMTYDSINQKRIRNSFKWSSIGYQENPDNKPFHINFGVNFDYMEERLACDSITSFYNQLTPFGGLSIKLLKSFHLDAYAEYVVGDYGSGDYRLKATLNQFLGTQMRNIGRMRFGLEITNSTPAWFFQKYSSNRFNWVYTLDKERSILLSGAYIYKNMEAGATLSSFSNYTFLNDSVIPEQIDGTETLLSIYVSGRAHIKKFGLNTHLVYQTTSQPNLIRVPSFSGVMDLYFKSPIFKKAATLQTGFQLRYFTAYFADAYMPELRMFYIQNEKEIGGYLFVDFYTSLKVKRAVLFFKIAHLNGYLGDYRYYNAPHYPARDARFYFGVSWRFHD